MKPGSPPSLNRMPLWGGVGVGGYPDHEDSEVDTVCD